MDKESLEKELETLTNKYNIIMKSIERTKGDLIVMTNEAMKTKGSIEQVNKFLALYNNEDNKKEEK